jgi:hypothetical protein
MCVHRDTGAQRAVKVLRKSHMDEDEKKMLFNEINILRNLVSSTLKQGPVALSLSGEPASCPYLLCIYIILIDKVKVCCIYKQIY